MAKRAWNGGPDDWQNDPDFNANASPIGAASGNDPNYYPPGVTPPGFKGMNGGWQGTLPISHMATINPPRMAGGGGVVGGGGNGGRPDNQRPGESYQQYLDRFYGSYGQKNPYAGGSSGGANIRQYLPMGGGSSGGGGGGGRGGGGGGGGGGGAPAYDGPNHWNTWDREGAQWDKRFGLDTRRTDLDENQQQWNQRNGDRRFDFDQRQWDDTNNLNTARFAFDQRQWDNKMGQDARDFEEGQRRWDSDFGLKQNDQQWNQGMGDRRFDFDKQQWGDRMGLDRERLGLDRGRLDAENADRAWRQGFESSRFDWQKGMDVERNRLQDEGQALSAFGRRFKPVYGNM